MPIPTMLPYDVGDASISRQVGTGTGTCTIIDDDEANTHLERQMRKPYQLPQDV